MLIAVPFIDRQDRQAKNSKDNKNRNNHHNKYSGQKDTPFPHSVTCFCLLWHRQGTIKRSRVNINMLEEIFLCQNN